MEPQRAAFVAIIIFIVLNELNECYRKVWQLLKRCHQAQNYALKIYY